MNEVYLAMEMGRDLWHRFAGARCCDLIDPGKFSGGYSEGGSHSSELLFDPVRLSG